MNQINFQSVTFYSFPKPVESASPRSKDQSLPQRNMPALIAFHLAVVLGLSALGTCLQFEFYKEHDVLPGYALPLAIAGSVGTLSLATVKFDEWWTDLVRKLLYAACYVFMVASSAYHVTSAAWAEAKHVSVQEVAPVQESSNKALTAVTEALNVAAKKGAWKVMETLGTELSKNAVQPAAKSQPKPFGISGEVLIGVGAIILIVLRALLEGIQAITAIAVRNHLSLRTRSN